ncbi:MAG TPA: O-antigen ligase family protein, partial [Anaerolineae bacterium]|nr:O-antigen ligase family protein [Anaerolineae bacterium]
MYEERLRLANSTWGLALICAIPTILLGVALAWGGPLAGLVLFVALAVIILVLRDMRFGYAAIVGVICLLPFATVPVKIVLTFTLLDLAMGAVVGIWGMRLMTGQQRTVVLSPITVPLVMFILIAIFAFIFGLGNGPLTPTLLRHFAELLLSLGFVIVVVDYCRTWEKLEELVLILLAGGTAAAAVGIGLWLLPDETANTALNFLARVGYPGGWVIRYIEENPELAERAIGTSVDPNSFGGLLVLIGALAGPQLVAKKPIVPRWVAVLMFGTIFTALILTFSRGAFLALVGGLGFVTVLRYRRLLPYLAFVGVASLGLPVMQSFVARMVAGLLGQDLATQMRFGEYRDALSLIRQYPLFGVGFAGSPDIELYLGVANVYLTIGQQMGVLGLLSFVVLIGTMFGYAFFNRHVFAEQARHDALWLGAHAAVVGGLVAGVFDHYLFNIDFHHAVTAFWLMVGLGVAATRLG